jgi:hypothetical protein
VTAPKDPAFIHTARTAPRPCPACHTVLDAATSASLDPADPQPRIGIGDLTVCADCGAVLVLTEIGFRFGTEADLATIDPLLSVLLLEFSARRSGRRQ